MQIYHLFNLVIFLTNVLFIHKFLHIYQLKDYQTRRYFKYFLNKKSLFLIFCLILFVFELLFDNLVFYLLSNSITYITYLFYLKNLIKPSKTPLKFTKKLSRLFVISLFILFSFCFYKHAFKLIILLTVIIPPIANVINLYDLILNKYFINKARKKLKNHQTKIIAITGSNGKTSVKNILLKILATEYKVQATPASFNTPLGIAKFINNELKYNTQFLILEYGARHKNDILKLCNLYGADFGIVTTISAQHLESFKSIENIFKSKNELPTFLQNKLCIFNIDNIYSLRMFQEKQGNKHSVSIMGNADIYAKNIEIKNNKTHFDLNINSETYSLETNLLGRHNISNICLATALAIHLEIKIQNIINSIKELKPTQHRLELIQTHINILDDSYNCSPISAKESLFVLSTFCGNKMVVTPGIIECGKEKYNINYQLGKQLAQFDYVIIIGHENKLALSNGIKSSQNTKQNNKLQIIYEQSLETAKHHFKKLKPGDTLLLLNDLPDDYN